MDAACVITPEKLAEEAEKLGKEFGFEVEIMDEKEAEKLGMKAFLAVGRASINRPKVIVMRYNGDSESEKRIGLVGKGLTYDTGGLSLKPTSSMLDMKTDMGGAATVIGTMCALGKMKIRRNVTAVVAACENAIGSNAYRPGDIIGSMNGKTIEITNTDAEGRLTLADALTYIIRKENVDEVIDAATLTGAIMVALGDNVTGVFSNSDENYKKLEAAGKYWGEKYWQMPIFEEYRDIIKSDVADLKNSAGRLAGSITAAKFLEEFIEEKPWMHLDIAGTAFSEKNGKYFNEYENGDYKKNSKTGIWNSYEYSEELKRYLPIKKYFANGILTRKDIFYRRSEELHIFSSTTYNSKNEIEEIKYFEENGEISQIKTYKDSILEKVVNYTHYKRNYSIYDKVINPQSGYEYYKARESLTQFKDLNLLDVKLENKELNLYSLKSSDNKDIFVVFQNYSPGKTSQDGIRWYEDPLKYFGIKEIFYGKRKSEKIKSYEDIVKDGYFEEFNLGFFPGTASITESPCNVETVVKTGYFGDGAESGVWKNYDSSRGDLISSFNYVKGILDGPYEIYFSNGALKENGEYRNGVKVVLWEAGPQYWPSY